MYKRQGVEIETGAVADTRKRSSSSKERMTDTKHDFFLKLSGFESRLTSHFGIAFKLVFQ